jgi:diguanylate cyclase (GGDEF)-like protein
MILNSKSLNIFIATMGFAYALLLLFFSLSNPLLFQAASAFSIIILGIITAAIGIVAHKVQTDNVYCKIAPSILVYAFIIFLYYLSSTKMNVFSGYDIQLKYQLFGIANFILAGALFTVSVDYKNKIKDVVYYIVPILLGVLLSTLAFSNLLPDFVVINDGYTIYQKVFDVVYILAYTTSIVIWFTPFNTQKRKKYPRFVLVSFFLLISDLIYVFYIEESIAISYFGILFKFIPFLILTSRTISLNILDPINDYIDKINDDRIIQDKLYQELSEEQNRLTRSQEIGNVGTWELDLTTGKVWGLSQAFKIYGIEPDESHIMNFKDVQASVISTDRPKMDIALDNLIRKNEPYDVLYSIITPKGDFHHINAVASVELNEKGVPFLVRGVIHDITSLRNEQIRLEYTSTHDVLTGSYNRRYFYDQLELLDKEDYLPLSIVIVDLNNLKVINDSLGHDAGNDVLRTLANVISSEAKVPNAFHARVGGDEFVIVLPKVDNTQANIFIDRIRQKAEQTKVGYLSISISCGLITKDNINDDIDILNRIAEDEMYSDKISQSVKIRNQYIEAFLNTLYERDQVAKKHSLETAKYAHDIGVALGFDDKRLEDLVLAAKVHDLGKMTISENLLNSKDKLTERDMIIIKNHPEKAYKILHSIGNMDTIANIVLQHHERIDGLGYPNQLKGQNICIEAKIINICDAFEAMTSYRPYKESKTFDEAVAELIKYKDKQFDSDLVDVFINKVLKK